MSPLDAVLYFALVMVAVTALCWLHDCWLHHYDRLLGERRELLDIYDRERDQR